MRPVVKVRKRRIGRSFWRRGVRSTVVVVAWFVCCLPIALVLLLFGWYVRECQRERRSNVDRSE